MGHFQEREKPPSQGPRPQGHRPEFIIVGLFVLRLARRLMDKLNSYPEKDADAAWIDGFLSHYTADEDLAELRGPSIDNFAKTWPVIIGHFIKQPKYPLVFTHMNPITEAHELQRLGDKEIKAMVDFADAAAEWGSILKLPGHEAQRIESLASQRKIAYWDR
ncbi:hypothetical protein DM02DRAFT_517022 [Periconia macrospinosa]|uniref:Uncharacterized protein n=1 Tax=Periconia macrospinosa TaxID=97972 RepID=A0A2V1E7G7_9PLEO|nr:hypothetical protein DM02DRAFT_517022 [Periconia macrospinosa]